MKIVLAIPTYNGATYLKNLLAQVVNQGFYKIYVLDDASTDDTKKICEAFPEIKVIPGQKNVGPVANRNRILGHDLGDAIFFLDDDMDIQTKNTPPELQSLFNANPHIAVVGATITDIDGKQLLFYYEQESNPLFRFLEKPFIGKVKPQEYFNKKLVKVAWVLEGAFAIRSKVFTELGGFDENFVRYQEGPDICKRTINLGYEVYMTNLIKVVHTRNLSTFRVSHYYRYFRSALTWYRKHALKQKPLHQQK